MSGRGVQQMTDFTASDTAVNQVVVHPRLGNTVVVIVTARNTLMGEATLEDGVAIDVQSPSLARLATLLGVSMPGNAVPPRFRNATDGGTVSEQILTAGIDRVAAVFEHQRCSQLVLCSPRIPHVAASALSWKITVVAVGLCVCARVSQRRCVGSVSSPRGSGSGGYYLDQHRV